MKIKALVDFKHGRAAFEKDKLYDVAEGPGFYFCASGWAQDQAGVAATGQPASGEVTLKVDDTLLGVDAPSV